MMGKQKIAKALLLGIFAAVAVAEATPANGELIDQVWAGHPVSYDMMMARDHLFIAYYDGARRLTVLSRENGATEWTKFQPEGFFLPARNRMSNVTGSDSHNYLTMTLDRDGYLHLSGNMHADPLIYYRSRKPMDITTLECVRSMTGEHEARVTYPQFFRDGAGRLVFQYRDGGSGNGNNHYNVYDPDQKKWSALLKTPLLDGEGKCSAYGTGPRRGPDGRFHMLWMWRDTPNAGSNHTLTYARSPDLVNWETSAGEPLPLPLTPGDGDIVDPLPPFKGLINMTYSLGFDADHSPVVAYHKYDEAGKSQVYAARLKANGKWMIRQLSDWDFHWDFSRAGSQDKLVTARFAGLNEDGSLNLDYRAKGESGRWRLNAKTLEKLDPLPRPSAKKAAPYTYPNGDFPGLRMNEESCARKGGGRWVLRWETLGRNGDKPREKKPPLSELRLYEAAPAGR